MKFLQASLIVFLSFFVIGCTSNLSPQPTQTETRPTPTAKPTSTSTPSPTATIEPSILESYSHVFAYADGEKIIFLDKETRQIAEITSGTGWVSDFKVSPDNDWIIYSSRNGTNIVLDIKRIGHFKSTSFAIDSQTIIYFDWISSTEFVVLTDKAYYLGSLDGSKKQIGKDINLALSSSSMFNRFSVIKSPTNNNFLLLRNTQQGDTGEQGCNVYFLMHDNGTLQELFKEENSYCGFDESLSWSPDGNFAGINYEVSSGGAGWHSTYILDLNSGELIYANEDDALYPFREISWSPDGAYFSYIKKSFTIVIQTNDLISGEVVLEHRTAAIPLQKLFWSPNGRYLMYGRAPNYMYIFDTPIKESAIVPLYDIPRINDYADYWWSSNSDGIFIINGDFNKLGGVYWYSMDTKQIEKVGDLVKYSPKPYLPNIIVKKSQNTSFSSIFINTYNPQDETRTYNLYLLDEENLKISSAIMLNNPVYPPPFVWVK
ncbi:MAG: WD40 repeat domain-containing protein [Anaerolineales bacterium]|nr:MAG: WD40 repeat domain-containing protein [Anaerolineales bacterium]